ncbi:MAG: zinc ribbon domain-containing protein [Chloroflexi bacterium]|nr:zinc ribbon domain-containing protein [Chloroflexota bacterium]
MPELIQTIIRVVIAFIVAYFFALWFGLVFWAWRDMQKRTRDPFVQALGVLFILVFNFVGLPLYLVLRPQETLGEANARSLEEETLLQEMAEREACPRCGELAQPDFMFCPSCTTQLKQPCPDCQRPLRLSWVLCPYCGTEVTAVRPHARSR